MQSYHFNYDPHFKVFKMHMCIVYLEIPFTNVTGWAVTGLGLNGWAVIGMGLTSLGVTGWIIICWAMDGCVLTGWTDISTGISIPSMLKWNSSTYPSSRLSSTAFLQPLNWTAKFVLS